MKRQKPMNRQDYWVRILDLLMLACRRVYITIRSQSKAMPYISHQPAVCVGESGINIYWAGA